MLTVSQRMCQLIFYDKDTLISNEEEYYVFADDKESSFVHTTGVNKRLQVDFIDQHMTPLWYNAVRKPPVSLKDWHHQ